MINIEQGEGKRMIVRWGRVGLRFEEGRGDGVSKRNRGEEDEEVKRL